MKKNLVIMLIVSLIGSLLIPSLTVSAEVDYESEQIISAGFRDSFLIDTDGSLWAWGYNGDVLYGHYGQLGDGTTINRYEPVKIMDGVISVSAGDGHTMAIKSDGSLWAWGVNYSGQIGDGTKTSRYEPVKIMDDVVSVSAGGSHTMAMKSDGSLWAWGDNQNGRLGDGTTTHRYEPAKIMDDVVSVSAGGSHTMAIKSDGTLWVWGNNFRGQIGDGTNKDRYIPIKIMDDVVSVAAGDYHSMAIKSDGTLWVWGNNEVRSATETAPASDRTEPVKIMDDVVSVAAGKYHSMAIKSDGSLWAWGNNSYRQLGDGTGIDKIEPVRIMEDVVSIAAGAYHSLAIRSDGSLWVWGSNRDGAIGVGGYSSNSLPPSKVISDAHLFSQNQVTEDQSLDIDFSLEENLSETETLSAVETKLGTITNYQKQDPDSIEDMTNYAEYAASQSAIITTESVTGEIVLDSGLLNDAANQVGQLISQMDSIISENDIQLNRSMKKEIKVKSVSTGNVSVVLDTSLKNIKADKITIESDAFVLSIDAASMMDNLSDNLVVNIEKQQTAYIGEVELTASIRNNIGILAIGELYNKYLSGSSVIDKYQVSFSYQESEEAQLENKLVIGFNSASSDTEYNAVFIERDGVAEALGGKYNKKSGKLEIKTDEVGTYYVMENRKSFSDINAMDETTKKAIAVLAAKGMINGKSETTFDPNGTITRAEFTKIIIRALYLTDINAENTFSDIADNSWYRPYVASSKQAGLINGYTDGTFKPENVITKQEMVKICAASLYEQKGYNYPSNIDLYVSRYSDTVTGWVQKYLALAEREGIVVGNSTGRFKGEQGTTRAEAAVMLYKLFRRL